MSSALYLRRARSLCAPWANEAKKRALSSIYEAESRDGWHFGSLLDGAGGTAPLQPWDADAVRNAGHGGGGGAWVHLDFRSPHAQPFLAKCYPRKRGKWASTLMTENPRKTQPRCEVSPGWNGLLLTLRVPLDEGEPEPFRLLLGRHNLVRHV